ncbi:MAG TPA: serine hydrolase domain-containing protein [Anaeromyxobacter sp.]|nr:serine hydrolase domain-containing protein [Anaeromyxobacter sp.]
MRALLAGCVAVLASCAAVEPGRAPGAAAGPERAGDAAPAAEAAPAAPPSAAPPERLAADTPRTTVEGNAFVAPAAWSISVRGPATILEAPEGGSRLALVDVRADDADAAVAAAWAAYRPDAAWPLKVASAVPDKDGWTGIRQYEYRTSPNERRDVAAVARRAGDVWTVVLYDLDQGVAERRLSAVRLVTGRLLPRGYARESFAGKKAHRLDPERIADLTEFVELAMRETRVPGVALGIVQEGKVVFADGFGVREVGKPERPDADTLFMIASNTKALTTLMLAKLVDEKRIAWDTPVTKLLPSFRLGDAETTRQVQVKHLVCACTGLPRQDLEMIFQFEGVTPEATLATLATMQPTSKFGETFQYSNPLASAGGYAGGHVLFPKLELGKAYDEAMRTRVFEPLAMAATTFDYARALKGNHAAPHAPDVDGRPARAVMELNYAVIPARPAGAAWSSVRDVLRYVSAELAEGALPGGKRFISREALLERRAAQVAIGTDVTYGMGLMVDAKYGVPVVHHGGDVFGFHSDMMWLPEQGVGAVVLTNGDPGWLVAHFFRRKLLEVLFDGRPEADADVTARARTFFDELAAERRLLTVPADPAEAEKLAPRYANDALGEIAVRRAGGATTFDFGEFRSEMASRRNPDGTASFVTIAPGFVGPAFGAEFVVGAGERRTLVLRDAQHEYVFAER